MMTLEEIKAAVEAGRKVYWSNKGYQVIKDKLGQWLVKYEPTGHCWGLTHTDEVTMNGRPEDFFMCPRFRIMVYSEFDDDKPQGCEWHDLGEGPWDDAYDAIEFAANEVGVAWVVVDDDNFPGAFGCAHQHFGRKRQ